jgi:hypothetical protein
MTTEQMDTLIFKDRAGEYYVLPQAVLEQGRVPEEYKAEVERLVAEAEANDTTGHAAFIVGMACGTLLAMGMAYIGTEYRLNNQDLSGVIQAGAAWAESQLQR